MTPAARLVLLGLATWCLTAPAFAARNVPEFELAYTPTQVVARSGMTAIPVELRELSVWLELQDRRPGPPDRIGSRTDDSDDVFQLTALNDVPRFVESSLAALLRQWGLELVDPNGPSGFPEQAGEESRRLRVRLDTFQITETNQAVGATYVGEVRLSAELTPLGEEAPLEASSYGDATRYGRKFSNANCNEVLSDALVEAAAGLLDALAAKGTQAGGEEAFVSSPEASPAVGPGPGRVPITPESLLAELSKLRASGFSDDLIKKFLRDRHLTRPLTAEELISIQETLRSEGLLAVVLDLPVSAGDPAPAGSAPEP